MDRKLRPFIFVAFVGHSRSVLDGEWSKEEKMDKNATKQKLKYGHQPCHVFTSPQLVLVFPLGGALPDTDT